MNESWNERFGPVYRFHHGDFAVDLRMSEGAPYVEASTIEKIASALEAGYAVYGEGCDGRVFVWPESGGYEADHFFLGSPRPHHFDDVHEAADFAAELCE